MKVLFISNLYPPNVVGGYERLCFEVADAMAARGHEISVLTSRYGGKVAEYPAQEVVRELNLFATEGAIYIPFDCTPEERARMVAENVSVLNETVERIAPDVVFVWNLYFLDADLLSAIQSLRQRKLYMLTDNWLIAFLNGNFINEYFRDNVNDGPRGWRQKLGCAARKLIGKKVKASRTEIQGEAVFSSEFMRDLYDSAGFDLSEGHSITYHGVNQQARRSDEFVDRTELLHPNELHLLFAGRITEIKGTHTAIESLPLIRKALPGHKVVLTIVGDLTDQAYVERLQAQVDALGLGASVVFRESVPEAALFGLFQQYDIYLFPSLYEPFSLTLIHALAAGVPTVASATGGNVEIVRHADTGMLFKPANAADLSVQVCKLVSDSALRVRVSEQGAQHAAQFTFERMVASLERKLAGVE